MNRRRFLGLLLASGLIRTGLVQAGGDPIRIGITPIFLTELTSVLRGWGAYLRQHLDRAVVFVKRDTYRETIDDLLAGRLEFAWICGYPYVSYRGRLALTAVPVYQGEPLYRAYLIVPARDKVTRHVTDLEGGIFAFSDPESNSGYLVPNFELIEHHVDPAHFFRKTFFTAGHRNAILAVSAGLADGAYVDGYVWETIGRLNPDVTERTRVVTRSRTYGFPPIVSGPGTPESLNVQMRDILIGMSRDPAGSRLLDLLNLDGFTEPETEAYDAIATMAKAVGEVSRAP